MRLKRRHATGLANMKMHKSSRPSQEQATAGRFEIEQDGHTAFLEYSLAGNVLQLIHTEVPDGLQGKGIASELAKSALEWAGKNGKKVDVICEFVAGYVEKHPEYNDVVLV
ncbi:MAG TPA: GNAT family N-acetyltransferase [Candidatus Angelobacter sp.]|nr:GNAT family N-acetyltransferase [Candidatus Angelobacter sp.]